MPDKTKSTAVTNSLFFSDGCLTGPDSTVITGHFNAYPDADVTRVIFKYGPDWTRSDSRTDLLRSVTYSAADGRCFLAGRNGAVVTFGSRGKPFTREYVRGSMSETKISDTKEFGELFRVNAFADQVFCCGQSCQVYRWRNEIWEHADEGILSRKAKTLEDIDGSGPDDIYAVGLGGTIIHFDGSSWHSLESPTNQPLSAVKCVHKEEVYICGNNGTVFQGNYRGWEQIGSPDLRTNFWDVDFFNGKLYLAHVRGLLVIENSSISEVKFPSANPVTCNRLHASQGHLLSVGVDDIWVCDGSSWSQIVWPDNGPSRAK